MKCSTIGPVKSHSGSVLTDNISKQMSSTPILLIYVQLWLILTDHQLGTFRLNQSITFTEIPLSTLQFFTVNIVYIVSSITSKFRLLCSLRIFLTILRRFATLSPSREEKSRETSGTRVLFVLVIEEVERLGRLPSLLREGLYKTYLLVRARANLDSDALNKVGFTPLSTLSFSSKESLST